MRRGGYKRYDDLSIWEIDKGCRRIIDTSTPARRRLRDRLRRQARKRLNAEYIDECIRFTESMAEMHTCNDCGKK